MEKLKWKIKDFESVRIGMARQGTDAKGPCRGAERQRGGRGRKTTGTVIENGRYSRQ